MKNLTKEWLSEKYWNEKLSLKEIAEKANVSPQTIYRHMKKWGIPRRDYSEASKVFLEKNPLSFKQLKNLKTIGRKRKIKIEQSTLKQLYVVEQKSSTEIAKIFKCSPVTIVARLKEAGIKLRTASQRKIGSKNPNWRKTGKKSIRWGQRHSEQTRKKISENVPRGIKHYRWKAPQERVEKVNNQIRTCAKMKQWKKEVFKRDNFACVICNKKRSKNTQINADHIVAFADIKERNNIKSLEEALLCEELWDVDNGRTLCVNCHKQTKTWGYRGLKK